MTLKLAFQGGTLDILFDFAVFLIMVRMALALENAF